MESRAQFRKVKRLVVKIGSSTLTGADGLAKGRMKALAAQMAELHRRGLALVLVSSGAVAAGFKKLGLSARPTSLRLKQASAAVGQLGLMSAWEKAFAAFGVGVAQVLLTADDLASRGRFLNARNTLSALLENRLIPIINENDTVAVDEIKVGDNDTLGAAVTSLVEAELFINLTDLEGLYDADPARHPEATLIAVVEKVGPRVMALAGGTAGALGTGGMFTKVRAAGRLAERGLASVIASGGRRDVLLKIIDGEEVGTFFLPKGRAMAGKKHWLAFASRPKGRLVVDAGAALAVGRRHKSLLPGGVAAVHGAFSRGDAVSVETEDGGRLAVGLTNYSAAEVEKIRGCRSSEIGDRLGFCHSEEVIHRDNLVLSEGLL